jgi:enoyl-CoA hydratase/carnithine racemase
MTEYTQVRYRVDENRVAWILLDGPSKLNAIADETAGQLREALYRFDADDSADVGIISGAGRAFCSGADVGQRQLRPKEEMERLGGAQEHGTHIDSYFFRFTNTKPLIAAVHGYATGLGFVLSLLCDLIVAEEGARFQIAEVKRGLGAEHARTLLYERGAGRIAEDMTLTARFVTGKEAFESGFAHRIVADGKLLEAVAAVAAEIVANPPLAVRAMIAYRRLQVEEAWLTAKAKGPRGLHLTEDFRESARAFMEKRKPNFVRR